MEADKAITVVPCPYCHQPHSLSLEHVGRKITCHVCRKPFVAESEDLQELEIEAEEQATYGAIECPKCVSEIPASDAVAGKDCRCAVCGFSFPVPVATGAEDEVWLEHVRDAAIAHAASFQVPVDSRPEVSQAGSLASILVPVATGLVVLLIGFVYFGFLWGIAYLAGLAVAVALAEVCRRWVCKALERNKVRASGPGRGNRSSNPVDPRRSP